MVSLITAVIGSIIAAIIFSEIDGWGPLIARKLINQSVKRISEGKRERYREEWSAHIDEMPTSFSKIVAAIGFPFASRKIARRELEVFCNRFAEKHGLPIKNRMHFLAYRVFDILFAGFITAVALPFLLILTVFLYINDPGPTFFVHRRIGHRGVIFGCIKFRTMKMNGDDILRDYLERNPSSRIEWEETGKLSIDPRLTWLGALVRKLSLDEFPQLLNVLRGEMSIVGPRPMVHHEIERYGLFFEHYCYVKPGLTGLWQISGRDTTTYRERIELDVSYVRRKSLWLDFWLLIKTVPAVLFARETDKH